MRFSVAREEGKRRRDISLPHENCLAPRATEKRTLVYKRPESSTIFGSKEEITDLFKDQAALNNAKSSKTEDGQVQARLDDFREGTEVRAYMDLLQLVFPFPARPSYEEFDAKDARLADKLDHHADAINLEVHLRKGPGNVHFAEQLAEKYLKAPGNSAYYTTAILHKMQYNFINVLAKAMNDDTQASVSALLAPVPIEPIEFEVDNSGVAETEEL